MGKEVMLKGIFNALNIFHYVAIIKICLDVGGNIPGRSSAFGGMWKFLTFWDLWFQLVYFTLALVSLASPKVGRVRDHFFASVSFPLGVFVCVFFWAVHLYDQELIFPPKIAKYYPWYANHMMHTAPILSQMIAMATTCHVYPSRKSGMATTGSVAFAYLAWVCVIAHYGGFWVYPFFKVMSPPVRAVFIVLITLFSLPLFRMGELVNKAVWAGKETSSSSLKKGAAASPPEVQHRYPTRSRGKLQKTD